ncbi:MAG TPA: FHA domain-containing protein [Blastocatellia bacterium]|nr:FHA domain-containing protein [Blastocatellia bacterium]
MVSNASSARQLKLRNYRYPGEVFSLVLTFTILASLYALVIVFFPSNARQVWQTLIITAIGLAVFVITVVVQQRAAFGTLVRVSPRQFPEIHEAATIAAARLSSPAVPVYVKRSSEQNIYTLGLLGQPLIVITSAMIDQMSNESLQFFIGREIGHIRARHTWLRTLLRPLGSGIPVIGKLLDSVVFGDWMNRTELTADRAGFIACDSLTVAVSTMLKFGVGTRLFEKLDIREFLEQLNDVRSVGGRVTEIISEQPYLIQRIRRLVRFALSNEYSPLANRERQNTGILEQIPQDFIDTSGISLRGPRALSDQDTTRVEPDTVPTVDLTEDLTDNSFAPQWSLISLSNNETLQLRRRQTTIGRSVDNDIVLTNDDRVSRNHAEIVRQENHAILIDCGSRNGVWLNHQRITKSSPLKPGDRIRIGRQEFIFTVQEKT